MSIRPVTSPSSRRRTRAGRPAGADGQAQANDDTTVALNALRALVAATGKSARSVERTTGLTNAQLFLLRLVAEAGAASIGELATRARTQQATVSIVVQRLVRGGYATKVRAPDDARRSVIRLTAVGRKVVRRAPTPPTEQLVAAITALSTREARALASGLTALAGRMRLDTTAPAMLFEKPR
jgi:DNA-binding MarR family transcriptional regulator